MPPQSSAITTRCKRMHQINAAACLSGTEVAELSENAGRWGRPPSEAISVSGMRRERPLLVHPPQLPVNDGALRGPDEKDILKLETFFKQVRVRSPHSVQEVLEMWIEKNNASKVL